MVNAGYVVGLNLQVLPYDWRLSLKNNRLNTKFEKVVDEVFDMFGKRVTLIAHSMGNYQVMNNLWKMKQEKKDTKILRYFAIAPPFAGTTKVPLHLVGMDESLSLDLRLFKFGITPALFKKTIPTNPATYQLSMGRFFRVHREAPWMKELLQRVDEERNTPRKITSGTIMDLFPGPSRSCTPGFKKRDPKCSSLMSELWDLGTIQEYEINPDTIEDILDIFSYNDLSSKMMKSFRLEEFDRLENPGVQVNIIYSGMKPTLSKMYFYTNPKSDTTENRFAEPDRIETEMGDGTVLAASAMAPGIKWAWEFNQGVQHAKPVNFIELCSEYKQRVSVYDQSFISKVTKNAYYGVDCNCSGNNIFQTNGDGCEHTSLMSDSKLLNFLLNSVKTDDYGTVG